MAAPKRTKIQRENDLHEIGRLYLTGHTLREISERISEARDYTLSFQSVANDVKTILARWQGETVQDIEQHRILEIKRLDAVEREAWQGFRASATRQHPAGNPAFLGQVQRAIETRARLLGLNPVLAAWYRPGGIETRARLLGLNTQDSQYPRTELQFMEKPQENIAEVLREYAEAVEAFFNLSDTSSGTPD